MLRVIVAEYRVDAICHVLSVCSNVQLSAAIHSPPSRTDPPPQPHQSVLLLAEDAFVMAVRVPKMLRYGKTAQAVARVVKVSGSER